MFLLEALGQCLITLEISTSRLNEPFDQNGLDPGNLQMLAGLLLLALHVGVLEKKTYIICRQMNPFEIILRSGGSG